MLVSLRAWGQAVAPPAPSPRVAPAAGPAAPLLDGVTRGSTDGHGAKYESIVRGARAAPGTLVLDPATLAAASAVNLGEALLELPGVNAVRRSASAVEPVIRGLGKERVRTQVGVVPVLGACPSGMDPPVTYFTPGHGKRVLLVQGLPSAALGPGGIGGRIMLDPSADLAGLDGSGPHAHVAGAFDSARLGYRLSGAAIDNWRWASLRLAADGYRYGNYTAPGGTLVPARQSGVGASVGAAVRPLPGHLFWHNVDYVHEGEADYPALPMDTDRGDLWIYAGGYRIDRLGGVLRRFDAQGGYSTTDHLMSNRRRSTWTTMEAETPSTSETAAGALRLDLRPRPRVQVLVGVDAFQLWQNATRTRHLIANDRVFVDRLWPDAAQLDIGAFVELGLALTRDIHLRLGLRGDLSRSTTARADEPSLEGRTVRENWVHYYGSDAAHANRLDFLGGANLLVEWMHSERLSLWLGGGVGMRAAGISERYYAFASAPGGFQVGNPTLAPETKVSAEVGLRLRFKWMDALLAGFNYWFADYVLLTRLERRDVDGDGVPDLVRGLRNVEANLTGFELTIELRPFRYLFLPLRVSYVAGWNLAGDRPLPEIPPCSGAAGLGFRADGSTPFWILALIRFAAPQRRVDAEFPENPSPNWWTLNARAGFDAAWLRVELSVLNILDRRYHEHLTREAVASVGGLKPGDEIPAPGRSFFLSMRAGF